MNIRISGIGYESLVNGPGLRRVIFSQGCKHDCKGCFNQDTHDFNGGTIVDCDNIINDILESPIIKGVTFSGGDPFEQATQFAYIAERIKVLPNGIWCYTGYTFEYILKHKNENKGWEKLINNIDVLVDGQYIEELNNGDLKFKGSSNQRIIDIKKSLKQDKIVIIEY